MLKTLSCLLAVLLGAALVNGAEVPKKKVLVVMIDGMRADAFAAFKPTTLTKLMKGEWKPGYKGAWTLCARTIPDAPAHSAPNHAAIATGVTAAKHKVTRNGTTKQGNWKEWPSWLHRLKKAQPEKKALYIHAWSESGYIDPTPLVTRIGKSDWANTTVYPKLITEKDCPDAIMYYINAPDGGGHGTGFYPYGDNYSQTIQLADRYLTLMLDLISKRPSFSAEDWLILVTADHGGYARGHGQPGGQSDTVPLIMAGKNIVSGKLAGTPSVTDLPVTALEFMGVSTAGMNLDGKVIGNKLSSEKPGKSLAEGLEAYMIFSRRPIPANRAKLAIRSTQVGLGVSSASRRYMLFGNTLSCEDVKLKNAKFIPHGMVFHGLEKLKMSNNHCFTLTFWVRLPAKQPGDSVIIGNKLQSEDSKTGFYISAARKTFNGAKGPGVVLNFKDSKGQKSFAMGTYDIEPNRWNFYAVTVTPDNALYFFQGRRDGYLHWFVEKCSGSLNSGNPWYISQPEKGSNKANLSAELDDMAVWNRNLTVDEIRKIFEAGRNGFALEDIIK
ncbi:MAG: alkaline phosphatase family protein [Lentisphaeria bacterium]|nr:alkaline phosphatase family protein [Lentisphaeria bacterium]